MSKGETPAVPDIRKIVNIWAAQRNAPIDVREPGSLGLLGDEPRGQSRWLLGLNDFHNFGELCFWLNGGFELPRYFCGNKLYRCGPIQPHHVYWLAIQAHGAPGVVDMDGTAGEARDVKTTHQTDVKFLNRTTMHSKYLWHIGELERALHPEGGVFFMGCLVGGGDEGTRFLCELSLLLPGRWVGAITSIGYSSHDRQEDTYTAQHFPGMRDTQYGTHKREGFPPRNYEYQAAWNDLNVLPWAWWDSPHAKVAKNGALIRAGTEPVFQPDIER